MKISVVLSARNAAVDVVPSLESALAALGAEDEIVAIDDGSTDETQALMRATLAGRRHQLLQTPGVGLTAALRLGFDAAQGDLIARLDAGDTMTPERLHLQRRAFADDPQLVVCGGNVRFVDEEGHVLGASAFPTSDLGIRVCLLVLSSSFVHSTVCTRRSAVVAAGGYREFFTYAQDFDLLLRMSRLGHLRNLPDVLGDYLLSSRGISATRAVEQYRFARIAWKAHLSSFMGEPRDPSAVRGELNGLLRARVRVMRRLRDESAAARRTGNLTRARLVETALRCCSPVKLVVGATVRGVEYISTRRSP